MNVCTHRSVLNTEDQDFSQVDTGQILFKDFIFNKAKYVSNVIVRTICLRIFK